MKNLEITHVCEVQPVSIQIVHRIYIQTYMYTE